jgi:hypothetical protein
MKYETPEMTALTPAINAIQSAPKPPVSNTYDSITHLYDEFDGAYEDWE